MQNSLKLVTPLTTKGRVRKPKRHIDEDNMPVIAALAVTAAAAASAKQSSRTLTDTSFVVSRRPGRRSLSCVCPKMLRGFNFRCVRIMRMINARLARLLIRRCREITILSSFQPDCDGWVRCFCCVPINNPFYYHFS